MIEELQSSHLKLVRGYTFSKMIGMGKEIAVSLL